MKNDAPRIFQRFLEFFVGSHFVSSKNELFMFGFHETFIYMTRYVMYHIQL